MPRIHSFVAGALAVFASALAAGSAPAQTSTAASPGSPLQLLQWLRAPAQPQQTTTKHHTKSLVRRSTRNAVASARHKASPVQTAAAGAAAPPDLWPATDAVPPVGFVAAEPEPSSALTATEPLAPGELVVGGQSVRVTSPGDLNEIDLAANNDAVPVLVPVVDAALRDAAASPPAANNNGADVAPKSDSLMVSSAPLPSSAPVGSASWIAQVLAALGGAVAAGSAAWFLIGAAPQRMYG